MDISFLYKVISNPIESTLTLEFISENQYLFAIFVPIISGEIGTHLLGVLIGSGVISVKVILVTVFIVLLYDNTLYFLIYKAKRKYDIFGYIDKIKYVSYINKKFKEYQTQYKKGYPFLLFAIKILPFSKITIPLFSLYSEIHPKRFFVIDFFVTFVWAFILVAPGYLVGTGFLFEDEGQKLSGLFIYGLGFIIFIIIFGSAIDKFLLFLNKNIMLFFKKRNIFNTKKKDKNDPS